MSARQAARKCPHCGCMAEDNTIRLVRFLSGRSRRGCPACRARWAELGLTKRAY